MRVHLIMQGKGGVGKTLISALISQYFLSQNKKILCIDTDPVNTTFAGYKALDVKVIGLMEDNTIKPRNFDNLIEAIAHSEADDVVVDNGASSFVPLAHYLLNNNVPELFRDMNIELCIHTVIVGSQGLLDCINGFDALVRNFIRNIDSDNSESVKPKLYVWLNHYFGPIEAEGKQFFDMKCFQNNSDQITQVLQIPTMEAETYGLDFTEILQNKVTFKEAYQNENLTIMNRQRLKNLEKKLFKIVADGEL